MGLKSILPNFLVIVSLIFNSLMLQAYETNQCEILFGEDKVESSQAVSVDDTELEKILTNIEMNLSDDEKVQIQKRENVALELISQAFLTEKQITQELEQWVTALKAREISVLEHVALSAIYRSEILQAFETKVISDGGTKSNFTQSLEEVLATSWYRLTGKTRVEDLGGRLPSEITKNESNRTRVYEDASFESTKSSRRVTAKKYLGTTQNVLKVVAVPALVVLSGAFCVTFAKAFAGMLVGTFVVTSVVEHFNHKYMGHHSISSKIDRIKSERIKKLLTPAGFLFKYMEDAYAGHTKIHHATFGPFVRLTDERKVEKTPGSYTQQFASEEHKRFIEERIEKEGLSMKRQLKDRFGVSLDLKARIVFTLTEMPLELFILGLAHFDPVFGSAMFLGGLLFQFNSADLHPFLHEKRSTSLAEASPLMRLYIRSSFVAHFARRHWVHHKNSSVNYNITPLSIGDFLFGTLQDPNLTQLLKMRQERIIGGVWDEDDLD